MDLAHMNMDLMQNGCPLKPCQSACMVKNHDTGRFECQSTGKTGSGLGINTGPVNPGMHNPMQPVSGGRSDHMPSFSSKHLTHHRQMIVLINSDLWYQEEIVQLELKIASFTYKTLKMK